MTIAAGTKLGRYEIRSKIGAGGMGEVYLAQDTKLDRKVALKILPAEVASNRDRMSRFVQEAKTASALNHPNIITIYEIEQIDSVNFIATEFIDGETLRQRTKSGPMKLGEVLDLASQVASALSAAHAAGIIHRDIKPENIMVRRDRIAKVLDFGLAKLTERLPPDSVDTEAPTRFKTDPGTVVGTVVYMSPEQARGLEVDVRTDIWSLGVVLYELVAGCLPFEGSTTSEVLASILSEKEPQPLARYSREAPAELERIVSKALRKDREERYQVSKDLLLDLKSLKQELEFAAKLGHSTPPELSGAGGAAKPADRREVSSEPGEAAAAAQPPSSAASGAPAAAAWRRRRVVVAAGVAVLVLAAAVAGIEWYRTSRATRGEPSSGAAAAGLTIHSLAVLPLANLSHDPDQLYFVDGMHDEIISRLSKLSGILVKNRASSLRYRDSSKPPAEIGRELGVDALISGSVSRANNRVAIRVQLVSAATGDNLWAETYQRDLTDVLGLQSEVAQSIVRAIGVTLNPGEQKTLASSRLVNPEAYEAYLRARRLLDTYWDESHYMEAKRWSERAIELDPNFPNAYITLAGVYFNLGQIGVLKRGESLRLAEEQGARAYALDPTPEAEYAMVNPRGLRTFEWRKSMEVVERWIASDPNSASAHATLGSFYMLCFEDRADDAIAEYRKAIELDPANVSYDESLGEAFLYGRRYAVALRHADGLASRHAETSEAANQAAWLRAMIYAATGDNARAIAEARKVAAAWPEQRSLVAPIYAKAGNTSEARQLIRLDEQKYKAGRPVDAANIALTYLYLGETDKVFGWLDRAFDDYDWGLVFLRNPLWDPVRKDPRFQQVVRRRFGEPSAK